jgi:hypothetical protein
LPERSWAIIKKIGSIVTSAAKTSNDLFAQREELVRDASERIENLIDEYFDLLPSERVLIDDTEKISVPSFRPSRSRRVLPTTVAATPSQMSTYTKQLCDSLNSWAEGGAFLVEGKAEPSERIGIGVVILRKRNTGSVPNSFAAALEEYMESFAQIRENVSRRLNTLELIRGAKIFHGNSLYIIKPIGQRFWTQTAALNDADEIAGTLLMSTPRGLH